MKMATMALAGLLATRAASGAEQTTTTQEDYLTSAGRAAWRHENLGTQISTLTILGGAFGPGPNGTTVAYAVLMGEPGRLAVVDVASGRTLKVLEVPDSGGSYDAVVSTAGPVYLASHPNGNLYRYVPGADHVENLGKPADHVTFIWEVIEGPDGKIYGACYPKSTLFEYDPATGKFRDLGPAKEGEDYARCLNYHPERKKLYVGVGSHAALIEVDLATREKRDILPPQYRNDSFAYSLGRSGDHLLVRIDPPSKGFVLNLADGQVVDELPGFISNSASDPYGPSQSVFYSGDAGQLTTYTPGQGFKPVESAKAKGGARAFAWTSADDGQTSELLVLLTNGTLIRHSPASGNTKEMAAEVPRQPTHLQNIICGPDGKIYSSGYVVGNTGVYNPDTGEQRQFAGIKQSEGLTNYGSQIYCGTYPHARISVLDTAQPVSRRNPKQLFTLEHEGQDRPFGMLGVPEEQKVFIGTVPGYGLLGGALAIYDPVTSDLQVHRNLMPNQGIVTFAYKDGILYGGTTIHGGLGIDPTEKEGKLFLWDVKQGKKVFETVPVPAKQGLSGLQVGPDGNIWGWAQGSLFVFDPKERKVIYSEEKFTQADPPRHFWRGGPMLPLAKDGFYGMIFGKLYHLDPTTKKTTVLAEGNSLELLTRDRAGRLYFINKDKLHRLVPQR